MYSVKVSIIMSSYNSEKYIRSCINSILNQSFNDFELIIIDDASSDKTRDIIKSYQDKRIVFIQNNSNLGLTKNLNKAIKMSKGKYIARIDSDDVCVKERLAVQYDFMEKHPKVDVIGSNAYLINENNRIIGITDEAVSEKKIFSKAPLMNPLLHPTVMMRSSLIKQYYYNENYRVCQDFELWNRLLLQHKIVSIKKPLVYYRLNSEGATRKAKMNIQERISILSPICIKALNDRKISVKKETVETLLSMILCDYKSINDKSVLNAVNSVESKDLVRELSMPLLRYMGLRLLLFGKCSLFINGLVKLFKFIAKQIYVKFIIYYLNKDFQNAIKN